MTANGGTLPVVENNGEELETSRGIIIEIPLKPRKRMISLRVDEEALSTIDKFVARMGDFSRTLIITKIIEAFAEALKKANYNAVQVNIRVITSNSPGYVEVVIPLRSKQHQVT